MADLKEVILIILHILSMNLYNKSYSKQPSTIDRTLLPPSSHPLQHHTLTTLIQSYASPQGYFSSSHFWTLIHHLFQQQLAQNQVLRNAFSRLWMLLDRISLGRKSVPSGLVLDVLDGLMMQLGCNEYQDYLVDKIDKFCLSNEITNVGQIRPSIYLFCKVVCLHITTKNNHSLQNHSHLWTDSTPILQDQKSRLKAKGSKTQSFLTSNKKTDMAKSREQSQQPFLITFHNKRHRIQVPPQESPKKTAQRIAQLFGVNRKKVEYLERSLNKLKGFSP